MKNQKKQTSKPVYNIWQCLCFMFQTAWKHRKSVIFLCLAMALVCSGKSILDILITPIILQALESFVSLPNLIILVLILSLIHFFLFFMQGYLKKNAILGRSEVKKRIIQKCAAKSASTSYSNTMDTGFIDMQTKVSRSAFSNYGAAEKIWMTLTTLLTNMFCFAFYLLVLSNLNPFLLVVILLTSFIGYYINKHINTWSYRHKEEDASLHKQFYYLKQISSDRQYAKDLRIFGLKNWLDDLTDAVVKLRKAFVFKREKAFTIACVVNIALTFLRNGVAYGYLFWIILSQGMSAAEFLLYFSAASSLAQWIIGILGNITELYRNCLDISIIQEFLNWSEPFLFEAGVSIPSASTYELRLEHVSYRYPRAEKNVLTDVSLTIHPGEKVAVVGLNGAGKTTLVRLLCGFLDPTEGRVLLNGEDIRQYNRREYYQLLSAVFQEYSILEATISENVAQQVDDIDEALVWKCLDYAGLAEKVQKLPQKLQTHIGRLVYSDGIELSGGETQRLILARSLYKNGPIFILDEPTAALDPIAEHEIYLKYQEMTKEKTSLFISHRLASTRFCDRILFLEKGNIAEEGTHQYLLDLDGKYAELFKVQSQYYKEGTVNYEL